MKETRQYAYLTEDVMKEDFRYAWKQEDLWELAKTKKVIKYKMNDVKHWVYNQSWSKKDCFVSIFQVLMQPKKFPEYVKRINKANLQYPLIVMENKFDKYGSILDGNHRFAKMIIEKKRVVPIVYFTRKELNKLRIKME
tara:strand:- start:220 stop:636 length:417 start_codon:yes stop_codon:yes gene_type:complete